MGHFSRQTHSPGIRGRPRCCSLQLPICNRNLAIWPEGVTVQVGFSLRDNNSVYLHLSEFQKSGIETSFLLLWEWFGSRIGATSICEKLLWEHMVFVNYLPCSVTLHNCSWCVHVVNNRIHSLSMTKVIIVFYINILYIFNIPYYHNCCW